MKLLNWFFGIISGETGINWLSVRFHRYNENKRLDRLVKGMQAMTDTDNFFWVTGAGHVSISKSAHSTCGKSVGFSFGVSWTKYPFCGGVIGRDEAKKLAEFILSKINECPKSESDEYKEWSQKWSDNIIGRA